MAWGQWGTPPGVPAGALGYGAPGSPPQYPGWSPQPGQWGGLVPYQAGGWGYQPAYAVLPPGPAPGLLWGGILRRLVALVIDLLLVGGAEVVVSLATAAIFSRSVDYEGILLVVSFAWWAFAIAYHPVCWYLFSQSLGQKAVGLRVVRASDGQSLGIGAVLMRYLIFCTSTALIIPGIVAAAMASGDPYKRAWHDIVARSVVVRVM